MHISLNYFEEAVIQISLLLFPDFMAVILIGSGATT